MHNHLGWQGELPAVVLYILDFRGRGPQPELWSLTSTHTPCVSLVPSWRCNRRGYFLSQAIHAHIPYSSGTIHTATEFHSVLLTLDGISQHLSLLVHTGLQTISKSWIWNYKQATATWAKDAWKHFILTFPHFNPCQLLTETLWREQAMKAMWSLLRKNRKTYAWEKATVKQNAYVIFPLLIHFLG